MIDINELRQSLGAVQPEEVAELLDRLEASEADALEQARLNGMGAEREMALMAKLEAAEKERDTLRARIEAMENQKPVAWISSRNGFICKENKNPDYNLPLIHAHGARLSTTTYVQKD